MGDQRHDDDAPGGDRDPAFRSTAVGAPQSPPASSDDPRSPTQQRLHDDVRAALFDPSASKTRPDAGPDEYEPGTVLGERYRIERLVGRGGMGEVYRARDLALDADVAIKFIPRRWAGDSAFMKRFVREVRLARQVTHPNVCRVHDLGEIDGRRFLSMEYIDGEDLGGLLRRIGRLPLEKALELAHGLCVGLAALHEQGVLHRDLKPENIMLDGEGRVKITDFGLAAAQAELDVHERRDGTPAYMAPEQRTGETITEQTDLYALGLVLYELLTGSHPLSGATRGGSGSTPATRRDTPERLGSRVAGLPREVEEVVAACLEPDPTARPTSALEVAARLPGGDPIAAALALGRTPSVDALVRGGSHERLRSAVGWPLVVVTALLVLFAAASMPRSTVFGRAGLHAAPAIVVHDIERLLESVGHAPELLVAWHRELDYDQSQLEWLEEQQRGLKGTSSPVLVHYRAQPHAFTSSMEVTMSDPAYDLPGAVRVAVDGDGHLRSFMRVSAPGVPASGEPYDWTALLEQAGLDPESLERAPPEHLPPVFADQRVAFVGPSETHGADVRVEAASRGGEPVFFEVWPQWDPRFDEAPAEVDRRTAYDLTPYLTLPLLTLFLVAVAVGVRRTAARGEADGQGAIRIGLFVFLVEALGFAFDRDILMGLAGRGGTRLLVAAGVGVLAAALYYVLESMCRRHRPDAMVSWVRLVRGRVLDPLVARDVLIGVALAAVFVTANNVHFMQADLPRELGLDEIDHPLLLLQTIEGAMMGTPFMFFGLVLLVRLVTAVTPRPRLGSGIFVVLMFVLLLLGPLLLGGPTSMMVAALITAATWSLAIVRFGLLAAVTYQLARNVLTSYPLTLDLAQWHAGQGMIGLVFVIALLAYGAWGGIAPLGGAAKAGANDKTKRP